MEFTAWLGLATLLVGFPLSVIAAFLLWKTSKRAPTLRVLRERYITAVITAVLVGIFGLIFVNNDQPIPPLSLDATKIITRGVMLVMAIVPAVMWLRLYQREP